MRPSGLGQFWGAEFENAWYTGCGRGLQPRFGDLNLVFPPNGAKTKIAQLKRKTNHTVLSVGYLSNFGVLSSVHASRLAVGAVFSLVSRLKDYFGAKTISS